MNKRKLTDQRWVNTFVEFVWNEQTQQYETLRSEGFWYAGPLSLATTPPTLEVTNWAFYDDGTESGSVIIGSVNTNPTLDVDTIYQVRFGLEETSGNISKNTTAQLEYNLNGAGWNDVNAASLVVQSAPSANLTDGDDTTQRITSFTFDTTNEGVDEVNGLAGGGTADITNTGFEVLYSIQILSGDVVHNDSIQLRIVRQTAALFDVYNQTDPTITVNEVTAGVIYERTLTSELDANDNQTRITQALRHLLSSIDLNDTIIRSILREIVRVLSSSVDVNDAQTRALYLVRALQSAVSVEDTLTREALYSYERILTSNISVEDTIARFTLISRILNSSVVIDDAVSRTITAGAASLVRILSSTVGINDSLARSIIRTYERILVDNVDVSDGIISALFITYARILSSNIEINDFIIQELEGLIVRVLTSSVEVTDSISVIKDLVRLLTEQITIEDLLTREAGAPPVIIERFLTSHADVYDAFNQSISVNRVLASTLAVFDNYDQNSLLVRLLHTDVEIADIVVKETALTVIRLLRDNVDISDDMIATFVSALSDIGFIEMIIERANIDMSVEAEYIEMKVEEPQ